MAPLTPSQVISLRADMAARLRRAREEQDISITELSDKSGVSRSTIYSIDKERVVADIVTLASLGAVLDLTWADMLPSLLPKGTEPPKGAALPVVSLAIACDPGKPVPKNAPTVVVDAETLRQAGWNESRTGRFACVEAPPGVAWGWPVPTGAVLVIDREPNRETTRQSLWLSADGKSVGLVRPGQGASILEPGSGKSPVLIRGAAKKLALGARIVLVIAEA